VRQKTTILLDVTKFNKALPLHAFFFFKKYFSYLDDKLAIGVAISLNSSNPLGPYKDYGKPIIESEHGVIDVHFFMDPKCGDKSYVNIIMGSRRF
jgi:hypothetical protein